MSSEIDEIASKKTNLVGIEPWKVKLLWNYIEKLWDTVDAILDQSNIGYYSILSEWGGYTLPWFEGKALPIHLSRIELIADFLRDEVEEGNLRIEDGGIKSQESLQRKKKRMRCTSSPETYLRDLSRLRIVCKDLPTLLRILKRFWLYIGHIQPWNLFLSRAYHRYGIKPRETLFPCAYLYLWGRTNWKIDILEWQLRTLTQKRDYFDWWQFMHETDSPEWKRDEARWISLKKRISRMERQLDEEKRNAKLFWLSTEVQFMTERVRTIAESNRNEYLDSRNGKIVDFTEYNRVMIQALLDDYFQLKNNTEISPRNFSDDFGII